MTLQRTLLSVLCFMMVTMQLGASCSQTNVYREPVYRGGGGGYGGGGYGGGGYGGGPVIVEPPPGTVIIREPPPMVFEPSYRWPRETVLVREGRGRLQWAADGFGAVYVVDVEINRVIAAFEVTRGQWVTVLPSDDRIYVNDTAVYTRNLRRNARHEIFYDRGRNLPGTSPVPNDGRGRGGGGYPGGGGGYPGGGGGYPPPIDTTPGWPNSARVVASGDNRQEWRATGDGMIYVVDAGTNRLIARFGITSGQSVAVEPGNDRIILNGRVIDHENLRREARHQILFDANGGGGGNGGGSGGGGGRSGGGGGGAYPPPIDTTPGWPNTARVVVEGDNRQEFRANADGTVYIVDAGRNRLIAKFAIQRGQSVAVEPGNDRIILAGRTVDHENLRREARHQILFDAAAGGGGSGGGGGAGRGSIDTTPGWPNTAVRVQQGADRIIWKATADGTVYVVDAGQNKLVAKFNVTRNQTVVIEPRQDKILVENRDVYNGNLRGQAGHQILFDRK